MADHAAFSPDGRYLATTGQDRSTRIWELRPVKPAGPPLIHHDSPSLSIPTGISRPSWLTSVVTADAFWCSGREQRGCGTGKTAPCCARHAIWTALIKSTFATRRCTHPAKYWSRRARTRRRGSGMWTDAGSPPSCCTTKARWFLPNSVPTAREWSRPARIARHGSGKFPTAASWQVIVMPDQVNQARFSPDGSRVVSCSADHTAAVWNAETGKVVLPFFDHQESVRMAAFSPDGRFIATGCGGEPPGNTGLAQIWDGATGEPATLPMRHGTGIRSLEFRPDGRHLITAAFRDKSAKVWEISRAEGSLPDLERLAGVVSGFVIDRQGGQSPRSPAEICRDHRELLAGSPQVFMASGKELASWLDAEGRAMENAGLLPAAIACYDRLLTDDPSSHVFLSRRGELRAWLGNWREAKADMLAAVAHGSDEMLTWYGAALLCLQLGETSQYEKLRTDLFARFGHIQDPWRADQLAFLCTLAPDTAGLMEKVLPITQRLAESRRGDYDPYVTFGAALFRAGHYEKAIEQFDEAIRHEGDRGKPWHWLFMALANYKLGQRREVHKAGSTRPMTISETHRRNPNPTVTWTGRKAFDRGASPRG